MACGSPAWGRSTGAAALGVPQITCSQAEDRRPPLHTPAAHAARPRPRPLLPGEGDFSPGPPARQEGSGTSCSLPQATQEQPGQERP